MAIDLLKRQQNLKKLDVLTKKLYDLIKESGNTELQETFVDWQTTRDELNKELAVIMKVTKPPPPKAN